MKNKELLKKIAAIYEADPDKGADLLRMLHKASEEEDYGEGFSVTDNPDGDEEDEASKWLAGHEQKADEKKTRTRHSDWEAGDLDEDQQSEVDGHLENGYSEREAHRKAGAHKEKGDFNDALKSNVKPSMMSDKMIDDVKGLAKEWLGNADRHEKLNADIEKNPAKYASGQMIKAHEEHMGNYKKAYNDFLSSDDLKDDDGKALTGRNRHNAIKEWKKSFREENPDHAENIANASKSQSSVAESRQVSKQSLQDKMSNIITGGFSPDNTHSVEAGTQHAGISLGKEGSAATGSVSRDPLSSFANSNQKLVGMLSDEQKGRFDRINSAASTQGKQRTIVRRKKDGGQ